MTEPKMIERADGTKLWYLDDKLHREDGPAFERANGTKLWYLDGKLHREDGPAFERADGTKEWWAHGKLHREDGPAIERADGTKEWCWRGYRYSFNDGKLRYGCETHTVEYWREHVRELCEKHVPDDMDFYEREIVRLIDIEWEEE